MSLATLVPNPPVVTSLLDADRHRLIAEHPDLPKSLVQCPTCSGKKIFHWYQDGNPKLNPVKYQCDCAGQVMLHRWLLAHGIDRAHARHSWADTLAVDPKAIMRVMSYVDSAADYVHHGRGLILWSPVTGTGKTLLEVLLLKALLKQGYDCYFTQFHKLLDAYAAGWRSPEERMWFNRRIEHAGILGIDDVGRERRQAVTTDDEGKVRVVASDMASSTLEFVVRSRVNAAKPMVITTNFTPDQMRQGYGGNVMSLLAEACDFVEVPGIDYRQQAATEAADEARMGLRRPMVLG